MENKRHDVPIIWIAALSYIKAELERILWNIHQKDEYTPFSNSGCNMTFETFEVNAYDWAWDEDCNPDETQPVNFKWRNVEITWYKHFGRGMTSNIELSADLAAEMLTDCLESLEKYEAKHEK